MNAVFCSRALLLFLITVKLQTPKNPKSRGYSLGDICDSSIISWFILLYKLRVFQQENMYSIAEKWLIQKERYIFSSAAQ